MTEDERKLLEEAAENSRQVKEYLFKVDQISGTSRAKDIDEIIQGKRTVKVVARVFIWIMRTAAVVGAGVAALLFFKNGGGNP